MLLNEEREKDTIPSGVKKANSLEVLDWLVKDTSRIREKKFFYINLIDVKHQNPPLTKIKKLDRVLSKAGLKPKFVYIVSSINNYG